MKAFRLGFGCALLAATTVVGLGCAEDNEEASNITGVAPTGVNGAPPPKTQNEYRQQQQNTYGAGYPGAGKTQ